MTREEEWYWLCNIEGIYQKKIKNLLRVFQTPKNVFWAKEEQFRNISGIREEDIQKIRQAQKEKNKSIEELAVLKEKGIRFIHWGMEEYPESFTYLSDHPYSLYVKGNLPAEDETCLAIIGARACTTYGKKIAKAIAKETAAAGVGIVSGLARGIDAMGHLGALEGKGRTYAVLGSGFGEIYPPENIGLMEKIIETGGGVLTEYPYPTPPRKQNFPLRNRLISGLSDAIAVVEAKVRSGSLITVEYALEQGKDIFAVPGRLDDPLSEGCNRLIKNGAAIITHPGDILLELGIDHFPKSEKKVKNNYALEKELEVVYSVLCLFPKNIHIIIEETGMEPKKVLAFLVRLELMGLVWEPMKNYYARREVRKD